jgi:ubiquinone/menaquinone biosynthesis C-methylase UbiE
MKISNSDRNWEELAKNDPYYAVYSIPKFHKDKLTRESINDFFSSGYDFIAFLSEEIKSHFDINFSPRKSLDFGCGVGRLLIPLSDISENIVGVDVSETMLLHAKVNCTEKGVNNVSLIKGDDLLTGINQTFDFITSYIVFQHIAEKKGLILLSRLIDLLEPNGIGAIHFVYYRNCSNMLKFIDRLKKYIPFMNNFINLIRGRTFLSPYVEMNSYNLSNILSIFQEK